MAMGRQILDKIERQLKLRGVAEADITRGASDLVVENGANDLTISYVDSHTLGSSPMVGVDGDSNPFLGVGVMIPGSIQIKSAINTAGTIVDVIDGDVAALCMKIAGDFANDLRLENGDNSYSLDLAGDGDVAGLGQ